MSPSIPLRTSRIPDAELQRLKAAVSVARLCEGYGIELKPQGKDLIGRCPFHEDRTPSFVVTPSKNLWHCLGACGLGGDNLQLVMKRERVSFRHAVEKLQTLAGVAPAPAKLTTRQGTEHAALVEAPSGMPDHELLRHVTGFYHQTFMNQPAAMQYLQRRCCFHPEAVKLFQIGFSNRTLGYRVPRTTVAGRRIKERLTALGIFRKPKGETGQGGHEHLCGSVVFPILDARGNVAQMYGRKITPNLREGTPLHLYLPGEHRAVWNSGALVHQKEWLVCESILDALTLWCAGFRNVTCAYGVNGWTAAHGQLLDEMKPERVILCYDNDEAGNTAAHRLAEALKGRGVASWRAKLPEGQDINDVACDHRQNPSAALAACIEAAPQVFAMGGVIQDGSTEAESHAPAPLPVSSLAAPVAAAAPAEAAKKEESSSADEHVFTFGERQWRVRGLAKNLSFETMKIQLRALRGDRFHLDTLDLCNAKHRAGFISQAAEETGLAADILKRDMGAVLFRLEELQEAIIRKAVAPATKEVSLAEGEREAALALLRDPKLLDRILSDFEKCGIVGETTNKLVGYLAAVSRKLDEPLAVIIQSTSAAGKSRLMEAILAFVPEEERTQYSAMTGQALFYLGDMELRHKVLAIVEEEGAERASYALKLLQSEGELTIASTGKDPNTGRMVTQEYHVEGPVMILLTTTAIDLDEELLNRCIVLTVDESREQTRAIHELQRQARTLDGVRGKLEKANILRVHRNAQRLLRPLRVVNPFARQLTFLDDRTRTRRDHEKYLTLIETIAFLHQYQRTVKKDAGGLDYVEVTREDIALANRLAGEVLGRSLDELPPQTRRLLSLVEDMVAQNCRRLKVARADHRFSRRDVREQTSWSNTALKVHLHRLEEMEYLLVHRARRGQGYVYEMIYAGEGREGGRFVMGLIDPATLAYDGDRSGQKEDRSGAGQPPVRGQSGGGQPSPNGKSPFLSPSGSGDENGAFDGGNGENTQGEGMKNACERSS